MSDNQQKDRGPVFDQDDGLSSETNYSPEKDWINQRSLAELLGIAAETASRWASRGKLQIFEHGMIGAGKRKYSRTLVQEYQQIKLRQARRKLRAEVLGQARDGSEDAVS